MSFNRAFFFKGASAEENELAFGLLTMVMTGLLGRGAVLYVLRTHVPGVQGRLRYCRFWVLNDHSGRREAGSVAYRMFQNR
jgi:hypothetical protein